MKYFEDELSSLKRPYRAPLRTLTELANEFGVPAKTLQTKLARIPGAPRPKLLGRNNAHRATWYSPEEVRAWWGSGR